MYSLSSRNVLIEYHLVVVANVESLNVSGIQLSDLKSAPSSYVWTYEQQSEGLRADVS